MVVVAVSEWWFGVTVVVVALLVLEMVKMMVVCGGGGGGYDAVITEALTTAKHMDALRRQPFIISSEPERHWVIENAHL